MKLSTVNILLAASLASCLPHDYEQQQQQQQAAAEQAYYAYAKRQNGDFSQLLQLASIAGIPVPSDNPALLLSIAPLAASLNALLPTAPVLSALETAAPSGLLSSLVHDPSFAASWIASFEQGPSPSWFLALPTSVRSYLHTYAGGGNLGAAATAVAGIASAESAASSAMSASAMSTAMSIGNSSSLSTAATAAGTQVSTTGMSSGTSMAGVTSSVSSSVSTAGAAGGAAARETGVLAAAAAGMVGILGLAVAL